jgi:hypothetical protein
MLAWVAYNRRRRVFTAEFKSGTRYRYEGVSPTDAKDVFASDSAGKAFRRSIRNTYHGIKLP